MCGINGISETNVSLVSQMNKVTNRRGPDGSDVWHDNKVTYGHNLLSIMSSTPIHQPYHYKDIVMVFNGAIFNFRELGSGENDTQVLAEGLQKEGKNFLTKCRGMWAVSWYNKTTNKLFLARDYFGIKPLYYTVKNNNIQFSSSALALQSSRFLDYFSFGLFRIFGYVPGPKTLFADVSKLCPGEVLEFNLVSRKHSTENLWHFLKFDSPVKYNRNQFVNSVKTAVEESAYGFRQKGVFLSGGLDSTSVAYFLNEKKTFTTKYNNTNKQKYNDDSQAALKFANDLKYNHTEVLITPENFTDSIVESIQALELPVYNINGPSYWYTNKFLKERGTVVTYSGDGGDEMYCGYGNHDNYGKHEDPFIDHYRAVGVPLSKRVNCTPEINEKEYSKYMHSWFPTSTWGNDHLNNCLFIEMITRVSEDFITRCDKYGSYFGMEQRFPLLNMKHYMYIMNIPSKLKMKDGGKGKFLARDGFKDTLPDYIVNKNKTGWAVPREWPTQHPSVKSKLRKLVRSSLDNRFESKVDWKSHAPKNAMAGVYFKVWASKNGVKF